MNVDQPDQGDNYGDDGPMMDLGEMHLAYPATEASYVYLTSGLMHSDEQIFELQKEVRYRCPRVTYVSRNGNVVEIMEDWPEERVEMVFLKSHCTVLRRPICFEGRSEPYLFSVCNCRCEDGKAGLELERMLEELISYGADQSSVKMCDFLALMNIICHPSGPPIDFDDMDIGGEEGLRRLSCVHIQSVDKILSEELREIKKREPMILKKTADKLQSDKVFGEEANVLRAMGVDTGDDEEEEEEGAAVGALLQLRNRNDSLLEMKVPQLYPLGPRRYYAVVPHVEASAPWSHRTASPLWRFGSVVLVSGRRKKSCLSHESQRCKCVYVGHDDLKEEDRAEDEEGNNNMDLNGGAFPGFDGWIHDNNDNDNDGHVVHHLGNQVVAKAYKERPLLLPSYIRGYPNPLETDKYRERKPPDVCIPSVECDCVTSSDKKCLCLLRCDVCDSEWSDELTEPSPFHIYYADYMLQREVKGRRCSNTECCNVKEYDGREDMVTPLAYHPLKGIHTGISSYFLADLTASMARSHAPLSEYFSEMIEKYDAAGEAKVNIPSITTLFRDVQNVIRKVVVPAFPETAHVCYTCGDSPKTVVMDGTTNGIAKNLAPSGYFNRFPQTQPSPSFANPNDLVTTTRQLWQYPCYLLKISVPWNILSNFSGGGDATALQELILRFSGAAPAAAAPFTAIDMDAIDELLNDGRRQQANDVISWTMTQAFRYYFDRVNTSGQALKPEVPSIAPVLQCLVAKSVIPVTGAPGQLVVACLLYLALGFSCQTRLPSFLTTLQSSEQSLIADARLCMNNQPSVVVNAAAIDASILLFCDTLKARHPVTNTAAGDWATNGSDLLLRDLLKTACTAPLAADDGQGPTIISILDRMFPQLATYVRGADRPSPTVVPEHVRPLMFMLADKALILWGRTTSFFLLRTRYLLEKKSSVGDVSKSEYTITFREIIAAARRNDNVYHRGRQVRAKRLLGELLECITLVPTTREENAATGLATTPSASQRYQRNTWHTADYMNDTHAGKAEMLLHSEPDLGQLGNCKKVYEKSPHWTPGVFTAQCSCKHPVLLRILYQHTHETPAMVADAAFPIFGNTSRPDTIIYDAVR